MHQMPVFESYREEFVTSLNQKTANTTLKVDEDGMHHVLITKQSDAKIGLVITGGLHGVEGYVASKFINRFLEKHLHHLNLNTTDVVIFNFINAWGMKHYRRVNEHNVDLNRNFSDQFEQATSDACQEPLLLSKDKNAIARYGKLIRLSCRRDGINQLLKGQSTNAKGLFYAGTSRANQTEQLIKEIDRFILKYETLIVLDLHTGMGPYGEMTYILDANCKGTTLDWKFKLNYPGVFKVGEGDQHQLEGDFVHYLYTHYAQEGKQHFFATLEFGIHYKNVFNRIRNMKHLLEENEAYQQHSAQSERLLYDYFPYRASWWSKANGYFDDGIRGILSHYNLYHF